MAEETRTCPYCMEEIKADATRCKHCRSQLQAAEPGHGGTCPYCKEAIHPEAIKCRHCGAMVGPGSCEGCGGAEALSAADPALAGLMPAMSGLPGQPSAMAARSSVTSVPLPYSRCTGWYKSPWDPATNIFWRRCCFMVPILNPDGTVGDLKWQCWGEPGTIQPL